jgi:hypothetical protein
VEVADEPLVWVSLEGVQEASRSGSGGVVCDDEGLVRVFGDGCPLVAPGAEVGLRQASPAAALCPKPLEEVVELGKGGLQEAATGDGDADGLWLPNAVSVQLLDELLDGGGDSGVGGGAEVGLVVGEGREGCDRV